MLDWFEDVWHETYHGAPNDGSAWLRGGDANIRVLRGGSWEVVPQYLRASRHIGFEAGLRTADYGFLLTRTL